MKSLAPRTGPGIATILLFAVLVCFPTGAAEAQVEQQAFSDAIQQLADDVAKFVNSEPQTDGAIRVDTWRGPAGGGSKISQALKQELEGKVKLKDFGGFSVGGSYEQDQNNTGKHVTVLIAAIKNAAGNSVQVLPRRVVTEDKVAIELFGVNADLSSASDPKEKEILEDAGEKPTQTPLNDKQKAAKKVRDQIADPQKNSTVHVAAVNQSGKEIQNSTNGSIKSVTRFSKDSPYGVELLVKAADSSPETPYTPIQVAVDGGIPHVDIDSKQIYALRIHNDSNQPVGVSITIDGIDLYTFSDNPHWKELGKTFIHPGGGTIRGWPGRGTAVNEFTIVSYGESAAGQLGGTEGIGSITVVFHPAFPSKEATGRGRELDNQLRPIHASFSKEILGSISIQYVRPSDLPL